MYSLDVPGRGEGDGDDLCTFKQLCTTRFSNAEMNSKLTRFSGKVLWDEQRVRSPVEINFWLAYGIESKI